MTFICPVCKQDLPTTSFYHSAAKKYRTYRCKDCRRKLRNHQNENASRRLRYCSPEHRLRTLLKVNTVDRSRLDFDWCMRRLIQCNFKCEITGIPFTWEPSQPNSLSIDRIDNTKGYEPDNIRFVCWWLNCAMNKWGVEKLKEMIFLWNPSKIT